MDIQAYCTQEKATLWDESKRLINPQEVYVDLSRKLYDLKNQLLDDDSHYQRLAAEFVCAYTFAKPPVSDRR